MLISVLRRSLHVHATSHQCNEVIQYFFSKGHFGSCLLHQHHSFVGLLVGFVRYFRSISLIYTLSRSSLAIESEKGGKGSFSIEALNGTLKLLHKVAHQHLLFITDVSVDVLFLFSTTPRGEKKGGTRKIHVQKGRRSVCRNTPKYFCPLSRVYWNQYTLRQELYLLSHKRMKTTIY